MHLKKKEGKKVVPASGHLSVGNSYAINQRN